MYDLFKFDVGVRKNASNDLSVFVGISNNNLLVLQDAEDLSFKKNDILVVVEQNEEKWWTAMDEHGNKGLIPEPYVKKVCTFYLHLKGCLE